MFAVQPQPDGANDSSVTLRMSPGSRAVDIHGARDRIDLAEVHAAHIGDGRGRVELAAGGIGHVEFQRVARCDARHGGKAVIPAMMAMVDRMSMCG